MRHKVVRWLVLGLGGIETLAALWFIRLLLSTPNPLYPDIGTKRAIFFAVLAALFIEPALIMGLLDRRLPLALKVLIIAVPVLWTAALMVSEPMPATFRLG